MISCKIEEFDASGKSTANSNNDILGLHINGTTVSDDAEIAEYFNDYFINIASNLKEPMQQYDFNKRSNYIYSTNVVFDLPDRDQNFVYMFLSSHNASKATYLDGTGPRLLKLSYRQPVNLLP